MLNDNITVQTSLMPFSRVFTTTTANDCKTVKDVVNLSIPYNFKNCNLVVTKNGSVVYSKMWESETVKEGDLIGLNFVPQGGGGDGKNTGLQIAIMVAVVVASIYTGGAAAAAFEAGSYGAAVGWSAATVAVGMVGSMAMQALMSVPKQSIGTNTSMSESQTSFIEGARNQISKYGVIPVNLGRNRMFPNQAALPYTETSGNNQYARQLFTYGYGKVMVTDRKFGETEIENFTEVEMEDRLNADLNQGVNLYANDFYQEDFNINVTKADGYVLRTTQLNTDEVEIDLTFQGLCYYNDNGSKSPARVDFEIQYAPTGTDDWSTSSEGIQITNTQTVTTNYNRVWGHGKGDGKNIWVDFTNCFLILNIYNGSLRTVNYNTSTRYSWDISFPPISSDEVVLGYIRGWGYSTYDNRIVWVDNRSNLVGSYINDMDDFITVADWSDMANTTFTVGPGFIKGIGGTFTVNAVTTQALRKSKRFKFPQKGQYDIRIRRLTNDSTDDRLVDKSYFTALRSISYTNPVRFANISGTALRIKATDQLSGAVDSYNAIVTTLIKGYNPDTEQWEDDKPSSNPADIFRYVLQSPAFAKHLADDKIDLDKLEEWWVYCDELGLTYNRVIDYDTSIDDVLNDICAAGVATLSKVDNIYSVIIDNERPIVKGMVTPRNSWDYKGTINYPEIPHALRIEFRNENVGYETDERIVFADGYDENNATLYERLQFTSCTNSDLAYWYGRRYFATALLQPETHTFKMDFEHMTFNRGDRITLVNDVILVGTGQGRIKELLVDDEDEPTQVLGFVIDDKLNIPNAINLAVRIRDNAVTQGYKYHLLQYVEGITDTFVFATSVPYNQAPAVGSLCAFVEDGKELDLIITGIKAEKNQTATITAIDYAPARFNPIGAIPEFESNITIPQDFYKPATPELVTNIQTDESVMIRNSDGSLTSVAVISLINRNGADVIPYVRVKQRETTEWYVPTTLKKDNEQIIITGLQDGEVYSFDIRYQRRSGLQLLSDPLLVENIKFIGGSTPPKDVQNFRVTVTNGLALFEWAPNDDVDVSHYVIKFSSNTTDVTWEGSQLAMDKITSTSITNIVHKGVYLIKAVDMLGNESVNATTVISTDTGAFKNVVEELVEQPLWSGTKVNLVNQGGVLSIDDTSDNQGYYYFDPDTIDLGDIYECSLSANIKAILEKRERIRDVDEKIKDLPTKIRNIGSDLSGQANWGVELQMNLSDDNVNWSGWQTFVASQMKFRCIKLRIYIWSDDIYYTPRVSIGEVQIDMPDRYETGEDVEIIDANTGAVVVYDKAFRNNPAVNITVQDGAVDDRIEFISKTNQGFTFKIFNATLNSYVTRSFDYIAAGYGRVS